MKKPFSRLVLFFVSCIICGGISLQAQTIGEKRALEVTATIQESPASIELNWNPTPAGLTSSSVYVYRKLDGAYGNYISSASYTQVADLPGDAVTFTDTTVEPNVRYEYFIRRNNPMPNDGISISDGFIAIGIKAPLIEQRGTILVVVDETIESPLSTELEQLEMDLIGDGWRVERLGAPRAETFDSTQVESLKAAIGARVTELANDGNPATDVRSVYLFGRVPVPYSGRSAPDGHTDHSGAWPTDMYYADHFHGAWSDTVTNTNASRPENQNLPGDGKYDVSNYYSDLDNLQLVDWEFSFGIGRVDFYNMPAFGEEIELLRRYLKKAHEWRHKQRTAPLKGIYQDDFEQRYSSSTINDMRSMLAPANVTSTNSLLQTLSTEPHVWAAGLGGGTYLSATNIGTSFDFFIPRQAMFFQLFGSYFADWDNENNFLRAPLTMPDWGLTCDWSGGTNGLYESLHRWPMGIGHTIGEAHRRATRWVNPQFANLMGDPALRLHIVAPPSALVANRSSAVNLSWTASADANQGYHVYRAATRKGTYTRLTANPVAETNFTDNSPPAGDLWYMVRAVRSESGNFGSYDNASQGVFTPVAAAVAAVPTGFSASAVSSSLVDLVWNAPLGEAPASTQIERSTSAAGPFVEVAVTPYGASSWRDSGLTSGTTYYYRISAQTAMGSSEPTSVLSVTTNPIAPDAPDSLSVNAFMFNAIDLSWNNNATTATSIQIQRSLSASGPWDTLATLNPEIRSWRDSSTVGQTTYYYRVLAVNADGMSASNIQSVTTPQALPHGLRGSDTSPAMWPRGHSSYNGTTLTINSSGFLTDGNNDRFHFAGVPFSGDGDLITRITPATNGGSHNDGGLMVRASRAVDSVYFSVASNRRSDAANLRSRWRDSTGTSVGPSRTASVGVINKPVWLKLTRRGNVFTTFHSQDGNDWTEVTQQTIANLGDNPEWGIFYTHGSTSGGSSITTFTDIALSAPAPESTPEGIGNLYALGVNSNTLHLYWEDLSTNEAGFEIERASAAEGPWTQIGTTAANSFQFDDTQISLGQTRYYRVRAFNSLGYSSYTAVVSGSSIQGNLFTHDREGFSAEAIYTPTGADGFFPASLEGGLHGTCGLIPTDASNHQAGVLQYGVEGAESREISVLFRWGTAIWQGGQPLYLGLGASASYTPLISGSGSATHYGMHAAIDQNSAPALQRVRLRLSNYFNGGSNTTVGSYLGEDMIDGNWYRLRFVLTHTGGNAYDLQGILEDLGASGIETPVERLSLSVSNWNNAEIASNPSVYPYLGGQSSLRRGIAAVDNLFIGGLNLSGGNEPTALESWRNTHFSSETLSNPELESTVWGHTADPDGDGLSNLLEYALGGNPLVADNSKSPQLGLNEDRLTLSFFRAQGELTYTVQASTDLTHWTTLATNPGNVGEEVTVTDDDTVIHHTRRFLRLHIADN